MHEQTNFLRDEFDIPEQVLSLVLSCSRTGSAWICNPPVLNTDRDILLLVQSGVDEPRDRLDYVRELFYNAGWDVHSDYHNADQATEVPFLTARKGINNAIVYADPIGFERFAAATRIAKELNLTNKADRVRVHIAATEFGKADYPASGV